MKFRKGDRVRMIYDYEGFFTGVPGTVVNIGPSLLTLEFDKEVRDDFTYDDDDSFFPLHDDGGKGITASGLRWNVTPDHVEKIVHPQMELFGKEA